MTGKRILFPALVMLCAAALARAQASAASTALNDFVRSALARNNEVLALKERITQARGLLRQAGVRPAPTLELAGASGRPVATAGEEEYSAGYFQPVETGGKRGKRLRAGEIAVRLAEADLTEKNRQLSFEIKTLAASFMAAREKAATFERLITTTSDALRLTQARVREGDAPKLDVQLLEVEVSRAEALQAAALGRLAFLEGDLRRAAGLSVDDAFNLSPEMPPAPVLSLNAYQSQAATRRPDLRLARLMEEQSSAELELTNAQSHPDVTLSARYLHRTSRFDGQYGFTSAGTLTQLQDRDNLLAFGVSLPLLTHDRNRGAMEASAARVVEARLRREFLERSGPVEVEAAYRQWEAAEKTVLLLRTGVVEASAKNLAVIREAYQLGQLRLLDVLNEQRRLMDAEIALIDAKADDAAALAQLERVSGGIQ